MDFELYCQYARENNVNCCLSELLVACNKHYIIKTIHDEIPSGKCATFDLDYLPDKIKIVLINPISLVREAFVLVDLKYLYDPSLFSYTPLNNQFAYLVYKN
jgi:hypothetical protein